jgi:hypothetical protein
MRIRVTARIEQSAIPITTTKVAIGRLNAARISHMVQYPALPNSKIEIRNSKFETRKSKFENRPTLVIPAKAGIQLFPGGGPPPFGKLRASFARG